MSGTRSQSNSFWRSRLIFVIALLLSASAAGIAQDHPAMPGADQSARPKKDNVDFGSRLDDIRTRLILEKEKKDYEEHVARAKETRQLAVDLKNSYEARNAFSPEDAKKLNRLEKLTRRIRNDVGGSDADLEPKDLPNSVESTLKLIAEIADELCKEVEKTPRQVVSATIIDQANKLVGLIQYVRQVNH